MRRPTPRTLVIGLVAGALALFVMPRAPHLTAQTTGDTDLAATVRDAAGDSEGLRGLSVALVEQGRIRVAGLGDRNPDGAPVEADTTFEIGSVTKTLTGMLLADQVAAGTVRPDDPLRDALPVDGPTGEVTLAELASHRAGLPSVPTTSVGHAVRLWWGSVTAGDPYAGQDVDWLTRAAGKTSPGQHRGQVEYSNLGAALLGQALAAKAGTSYPELLERTLFEPLGMRHTYAHRDGAAPPAGHAQGGRASGRPADPWTGSGWLPAGVGTWSTAGDLGTFLAAVLAGTAPGLDATTPRFEADGDSRIGYGWFTTRHGDRDIVWHNGGTGGFRAYVGLDRAAGRGVVVLGNTDRSVDPIGLRLLGVPQEDLPDADGIGLPGWVGVSLALGFSFFGGLSLLGAARRGADRLALVDAEAWAVASLLLAYQLGEWTLVPGWIWAVGCGISAAGLVAATRRWPTVPPVAGVPWRRWTSTVVTVAIAAGAVLAVW